MRRISRLLVALVVIALAVVTAAYANTSSTRRSTGADGRQQLMADHRGGTLKLLAKAAGGTLDPQVNYTLQYWQLYQATYDGLLAFKKAGGDARVQRRARPRRDAADADERRQDVGVQAPQGDQVLERQGGDARTTSSPRSSASSRSRARRRAAFYAGIVGADACLKKPATCTLKGGVSRERRGAHGDDQPRSRPIRSSSTSSPFRTRASCRRAARRRTPARSRFPGTGAYYFASYNPNKQLVMKRNPYFKQWSQDAQPDGYPDQITAVLRPHGRGADHRDRERPGRLDARDAARRPARTRSGTKYASQVHVNPLTAFWYAPMNTNLAPFNNLKARQAVNYAIDRNAAVKIFGGPNLATPSCQVLPPGLPGLQADYCPYTKNPGTKWSAPDLAKAKQLVKESGTAGQKVAVCRPTTR